METTMLNKLIKRDEFIQKESNQSEILQITD
jgi:hypothetical protein